MLLFQGLYLGNLKFSASQHSIILCKLNLMYLFDGTTNLTPIVFSRHYGQTYDVTHYVLLFILTYFMICKKNVIKNLKKTCRFIYDL